MSPREGWASDALVRRAALKIEAHVAAGGWDQPARLYALVPTSDLLVAEPALAARLGLDGASAAGSFTPVEQDDLPADRQLEDALPGIGWPPEVVGCAAALERFVLPADVEDELLRHGAEATQSLAEHPRREEVRIVAAATRDGRAHCAVRLRAHDRDDAVLEGTDLVPGLLTLLWQTLAD